MPNDPKPPTQENVERARAVADHLNWHDRIEMLAAEFQASDAIARRRAIEEALAVLTSMWCEPGVGVYECTDRVRALLRAPTSEKSEET